ncbi:hypothetical protein BDZ97DRAFT_838989 [Flammula alnicola]|nr:hypothetical protein BDZ97DRAFT_838989 [Flammula alnicola]
MLLVAPTGPGPLLPPVPITIKSPILSATMSTVDLGPNCLSLGMGMGSGVCGGGIITSKSTIEPPKSHTNATASRHTSLPAHLASVLDTPTSPTTASFPTSPPLTPTHSSTSQRHNPLALFAKIKRQLSKANVRPYSTHFINGHMAAPEDLDELALPTFPPHGGHKGNGNPRSRAITLTSGSMPVVSFASSPSFRSASSLAPTQSSAFTSDDVSASLSFATMSSANNNAPAAAVSRGRQRKRGRRRRSSASGSGSGSGVSQSASVVSSPSSYSCDSTSVSDARRASLVGVGSSSFIGSSSSFFDAFDRGRDGQRGGRRSEVGDGFEDTDAYGLHDEDSLDTQSVLSYEPFLPLIIQHERLQQRLQARLSLEEAASLSRVSIGSQSQSQRRAQKSKHVPPPLYPSTAKPSRDVQAPQYSPTSTASTRSLVTPSTPFFTASESASLEGNLEGDDGNGKQEEDKEDDNSVFSVAFAGRGRGKRPGGQDEVLSASHIPTTTTATTTFGPASVSQPRPSVSVHVEVLPPMPTLPSLSSGSTPDVDPSSASTNDAARTHTHAQGPRLSQSRSRQTLKGKSPPMSPPPSGPLPLPPSPAHGVGNSRSIRVDPQTPQHHTLSPQSSHDWTSQSSNEWSTHRHPSLLANWSLSTSLSLSGGESDPGKDDSEDILNIPDDSGVAFELDGEGGAAEMLLDDANFFCEERLSSDNIFDVADSVGVSDAAEEQPRAAILAANTRANANANTNGHLQVATEKIGIGRRQVSKSRTGAGGKPAPDLEWTLCLGAPSGLKSNTTFPSLATTTLVSAAAASIPQAPSFPLPVPSSIPSVSITPFADRVSLRGRTKSESALGAGSRRKGQLGPTLNAKPAAREEDWTLSLPLPPPRESTSRSKSTARVVGEERRPDLMPGMATTVEDVDVSVEGVDLHAGVEDEESLYLDAEDEMDMSPRRSIPMMEVEQVILCVPRVVTNGSGIESATRSRSQSRTRTKSMFEEEKLERDHKPRAKAKAKAEANLAKLDTLSSDLARFNEMLRTGGSRLGLGHGRGMMDEQGPNAEALLRGGPGVSAGAEKLSIPTQSRTGLKHARSFGVLEVDEPPPKNAVLRMPSVGDLLGAGGRTRLRTKSAMSAVDPARATILAIDVPSTQDVQTLPRTWKPMDKPEDKAQVLQTSSLPPSLAGSRSRATSGVLSSSMSRTSGLSNNGNGNSASSSTMPVATTTTKIRGPLPFAPPAAFAYKKVKAEAVEKSEDFGSAGNGKGRPGLAAGSALNVKSSKSAPSLRVRNVPPAPLKVVMRPTSPPVSADPVVISDAESSDISATQLAASPSANSKIQSRSSISSASSISTSSSVTTPTQIAPLLLSISSSPSPSATSPPSNRRVSISSVSSTTSSGSSSSLTPTSSPVSSPSSQPTTRASSFPSSSSSPLMTSSSGEGLGARPAAPNATVTKKDSVKIGMKYQPPSTASSTSSKGSDTSVGSTKTVVPTVEQRIRQLRQLGVDAIAIRDAGIAASVKAVGVKEKAKETEMDTESLCSGTYYSARSSFSS